MALQWQLSEAPGATDYPFHNYGVSDIAAGKAVTVDTTNVIDGTYPRSGVGIVLPSADGVAVIGVTMETIPAGKSGRVRCIGPIVKCTASGAITARGVVMGESATGKVKAQTAAKAQLGMALTSAIDADDVLVMVSGAFNA